MVGVASYGARRAAQDIATPGRQRRKAGLQCGFTARHPARTSLPGQTTAIRLQYAPDVTLGDQSNTVRPKMNGSKFRGGSAQVRSRQRQALKETRAPLWKRHKGKQQRTTILVAMATRRELAVHLCRSLNTGGGATARCWWQRNRLPLGRKGHVASWRTSIGLNITYLEVINIS